MQPGCARHVFVRETNNPGRRFDRRNAQWLGYPTLDCLAGGCDIKVHFSAKEVARIEVAKQDVGIRYGWLPTAAAITRWPRIGARALRADAQKLQSIEAGNTAAASTDLYQLHRRNL